MLAAKILVGGKAGASRLARPLASLDRAGVAIVVLLAPMLAARVGLHRMMPAFAANDAAGPGNDLPLVPHEAPIVASQPFQHHRGVFLLFIAIVREQSLEFGIGGGIDALVVPVDGFQFFHERRRRAMTIDGFRTQFLGVFVQAGAAGSHAGFSAEVGRPHDRVPGVGCEKGTAGWSRSGYANDRACRNLFPSQLPRANSC